MSASRVQLAWDLPGNGRRTRMMQYHQHSRTRCDLFDLFGELTTRPDSICFTTEKLRVNIPQDVAPVAAPGATGVFGKSECPFRFAARICRSWATVSFVAFWSCASGPRAHPLRLFAQLLDGLI